MKMGYSREFEPHLDKNAGRGNCVVGYQQGSLSV